MTKPPLAGSRAPRWMLDSLPLRLPEPHSTASTTRSSVRTGLTFASSRRGGRPRRARSAISRPRPRSRAASARRTPAPRGVAVTMRSTRFADGTILERRATLRVRPVEQIDAVDVQHIEEEDRRPPAARQRRVRRRAKRDAVSWNGSGRVVASQRERLSVGDEAARASASVGGDAPQTGGDVVERAREERTSRPLVDLDARTVELRLECGRATETASASSTGRRSARASARARTRPRAGTRRARPLRRHRRGRDRRQIAAEHRRATDLAAGRRPPSRSRRTSRRQRSLTQLPAEQPRKKACSTSVDFDITSRRSGASRLRARARPRPSRETRVTVQP